MKEKLLLAAASLLGFATACDQEERLMEMYGCPFIDYKVKGKVTDPTGNPIPGIEVRGEGKSAASGDDGSYELSGTSIPQRIEVTFTDKDGPANGGDFAEKRVTVEFTEADLTAPGEGWHQGTFARSGVDVQLEEKK